MIRRVAVVIAMVLIAAGFSAGGCMGTVQSPSGLAMPTGNVVTADATFAPIYSEDFNTPAALGTVGADTPAWEYYGYNWAANHEYPDPGGNAYYAPLKVISHHDGQMDMWFHTDGGNGRHYLATMMSKTNQLYGRFALRMKASGAMPGYHVTPLLWPQSGVWPRDGEVDFPDVWMDSASSKVSAFMHHQGATCNPGLCGGDQDYFDTGITPYEWITWVMDWLPTKVIFYKQIGTGALTEFGRSTTRIPNTPMHWVLQFDSYPDHPIANATQGHVLIDWVVGYRKV